MPDLFLKEPVLLDDWSPPYLFLKEPVLSHGNKPLVDFFQEDNHMYYHFFNEIVT